ncbi:MAG TPA: helix-turn-helix transcriptional regulator [Rhizorhapis sp.]|nr:helix-turn-helix transcriptional regulator [Rhizomicrobium sp.]HKX35952.1 helix-turn-helix transcriptional regulator [Rhizorhapis sp.]
MKIESAADTLSALAHGGRLAIFRLLVKAGPAGLAAGDIARKLDTQPNTMSAQLLVLSNAGLIRARRDGRSIIYTADFPRMTSLLKFLTEDCCNGRPEICAPLSAAAAQNCTPKKGNCR